MLSVVDLASASHVSDICDVCNSDTGSGFFHLRMTPQQHAAAERVLALSRALFALPPEKKAELANARDTYLRYQGVSIPGSGPGYRGAAADPNFAQDTRESFNISRDTSCDADPPHGLTPWPSEDDVPGLRAACDEYAEVLLDVSRRLRRAIATALAMPAGHFDAPGLFDRSTWLLGFVHYHCVASDPGRGVYGIKPHQDDGIFTLLHTDGSPGLQICPAWRGSGLNREAAMLDEALPWMSVPHLPGHWVVNLGTLLQRWSNGKFKATLHRVVMPEPDGEHSDRYSLPFFYEANIDARIECLPSCRDRGEPLPPTTPGEIHLKAAIADGLELLPTDGLLSGPDANHVEARPRL